MTLWCEFDHLKKGFEKVINNFFFQISIFLKDFKYFKVFIILVEFEIRHLLENSFERLELIMHHVDDSVLDRKVCFMLSIDLDFVVDDGE